MPSAPDLLLVNASVRTMDPARPRATAVAVAGGRVTYVGDEAAGAAGGASIASAASAAGRVIDLRGATLVPGFHDAHNHMIGFGLSLTEVDLRAGSLDELYDRVAARAAVTPAGEWIIGAGYDQTKTGAHPHRDALDRIAPGHRVWLKHTSGHMCVVNSPDGSLVGRTAAMSAPYDGDDADGGENRGYLQAAAGRLTETIIAAHRAGWRVAAHAIGDRAIDLALDAFAAAAGRYPRRDPRHRIEHFAAARPDQVARAAALGVIPVGQGRFATELGDGMLASVGPARHSWLYRQRSLLDAGIVLAGSSDRPVVPGAPLLGIHDMVNRRTAAGAAFNAGEAVTALEALRAYTWGSACASAAERVKGSIEVGKLADFTVLSEDPVAVSPTRIAGLEVIGTIVDGQLRYGALDLPGPPGQAGLREVTVA